VFLLSPATNICHHRCFAPHRTFAHTDTFSMAMSIGLLEQARRAGTASVVEMDDVQFLAFYKTKVSSIGTRDLAGCSVVTITSSYGAIVAHISPNPNLDRRPLRSRLKSLMDLERRIQSILYTACRWDL
jgi:hypothetical protein